MEAGAPETRVILLLLGLWFLVNLLTASRSPTAWLDEVVLADPAFHLAFEGELRNFMLGSDPRVPALGQGVLYQVLLAGWIRLFGFGIVPVRAFSLVCYGLAVLLLWRAATRGTPLLRPRAARWMVLLLLTGFGVTYSYRSGRYDALCILVVVAASIQVVRAETLRARVGAAALVALLPLAGLHLLPWAAILWLFAMIPSPGWARRTAGVVVSGMAAGLGILFLLCLAAGTLGRTAGRIFANTALGGSTPWTWRAAGRAALEGAAADPSLLLLLLVLAVALPVARRGLPGRASSPAPFILGAILVAACSILTMAVVRLRFPLYYSYMGFLPAALAAAVLIDRIGHGAKSRLHAAALVGMGLAAAVGLPLRLAVTAMEWERRDYSRVEAFLREEVAPGAVVTCSSSAYYAARDMVGTVYGIPVLPFLAASERDSIDTMVLRPEEFSRAVGHLPGTWVLGGTLEDSAGKLADRLAQGYHLQVYSRKVGESR